LNNNRNNNRRRGRGNNRQQGGGGQQLNRIDSRARGNAPQMLEKYRKLAQDAHLNGDRVQAEYYLQFADHYFRVVADTRLRQEEQRRPRDERFGGDGSFEDGDEGEFGSEGDMPTFDQPMNYRRDEPREPRLSDGREGREGRGERPRRERFERAEEAAPAEPSAAEPPGAVEPEAAFEPASGNPFTRDNRASRGLRPRREHRDERLGEPPVDDAGGLDPAALPPAISEPRVPAGEESEGIAPAPRRRGRPRRAVLGRDGGESLEAVNG
jgi:hypothetical protein